MKLLLVRHGQSEANAVGSLDCSVPGPGLTERGREQAGRLADRLADEDIRAVYASTMTRAQQTAEALAAQHGLPLQVLDGVHEVFVGDLNERVDEEAHALLDELFTAWLLDGELTRARPDGESAQDAVHRITADLDLVRDRHAGDGGTVVVVGHGMALRLGAVYWAEGVGGPFVLRHPLLNTGIVQIDVPEPGDGMPRVLDWAGREPDIEDPDEPA